MSEKKNISENNKSNPRLDSSLLDLSDLVVEGLKDEIRDEWKADAEYTLTLKSHLYANLKIFQERFIKGYEILMEEIEKEKSSTKDKELEK